MCPACDFVSLASCRLCDTMVLPTKPSWQYAICGKAGGKTPMWRRLNKRGIKTGTDLIFGPHVSLTNVVWRVWGDAQVARLEADSPNINYCMGINGGSWPFRRIDLDAPENVTFAQAMRSLTWPQSAYIHSIWENTNTTQGAFFDSNTWIITRRMSVFGVNMTLAERDTNVVENTAVCHFAKMNGEHIVDIPLHGVADMTWYELYSTFMNRVNMEVDDVVWFRFCPTAPITDTSITYTKRQKGMKLHEIFTENAKLKECFFNAYPIVQSMKKRKRESVAASTIESVVASSVESADASAIESGAASSNAA